VEYCICNACKRLFIHTRDVYKHQFGYTQGPYSTYNTPKTVRRSIAIVEKNLKARLLILNQWRAEGLAHRLACSFESTYLERSVLVVTHMARSVSISV
jgi:hypothetical protein